MHTQKGECDDVLISGRLPHIVQKLHYILIERKHEGNITTHATQPGSGPFVEPV